MVPTDFSIMGKVLELLKEFPRTRHYVDTRHKGSGLVMFPAASPSRLSPYNCHGIPEAPIPIKNPTYRTKAKTFEQEELRGLGKYAFQFGKTCLLPHDTALMSLIILKTRLELHQSQTMPPNMVAGLLKPNKHLIWRRGVW